MRNRIATAMGRGCFVVFVGVAAACSSSSGSGSHSSSGSSSSGGSPSSSTGAAGESSGCLLLGTVGDACTPCLMENCNAEQSAYAGPDWATQSIANLGGACGGWFMCNAQCACDDAVCYDGCTSKMTTAACLSAEMAVTTCTSQKCAGMCGGGGSSSMTMGSTVCTLPNGGSGSCPTAQLLGCCKTPVEEVCFYPPLTAATGMETCSAINGATWSATQ